MAMATPLGLRSPLHTFRILLAWHCVDLTACLVLKLAQNEQNDQTCVFI